MLNCFDRDPQKNGVAGQVLGNIRTFASCSKVSEGVVPKRHSKQQQLTSYGCGEGETFVLSGGYLAQFSKCGSCPRTRHFKLCYRRKSQYYEASSVSILAKSVGRTGACAHGKQAEEQFIVDTGADFSTITSSFDARYFRASKAKPSHADTCLIFDGSVYGQHALGEGRTQLLVDVTTQTVPDSSLAALGFFDADRLKVKNDVEHSLIFVGNKAFSRGSKRSAAFEGPSPNSTSNVT